MTKTIVKNGNVENALKRFKQQVAKMGPVSEFNKRADYSKPGVLRREANKNTMIHSTKPNRKHRTYDQGGYLVYTNNEVYDIINEV